MARWAKSFAAAAAALGGEASDPPRAGIPTQGPTWVTGDVIDRSGLARYTHLIRAEDDPDRSDIRALPEPLRDRTAEWRRKIKSTPAAHYKPLILKLLSYGVPRTFNEIGVLLLDKTADLLFNLPPDRALWELVAEGKVEHTLEAPILFRRARRRAPRGGNGEPRGLKVGDSVRRCREVGRVLEFVEPRPGWHRALVRWGNNTEQFVDVERLTPWDAKEEAIAASPFAAVADALARASAPQAGPFAEAAAALAAASAPHAPKFAGCDRGVDAEAKGRRGGAWSSSNAPVRCGACGEEWPRDPALEVSCPTCRAKVGSCCKSPSGHKAMSLHRARLKAAVDAGLEKPCPGPAAEREGRERNAPAVRSARRSPEKENV